jgi:hypothetical protein
MMVSLFKVATFALLIMTASGCAGRGATANAKALYAAAARHDPRGKPYVIGVADVVRVSVWKDPSLSTDAIVRPDGTITMPLVGELRAAGRTAAQLQADATQRLATIVKDAAVTVSVTEVNSYRFSVSGNVAQPLLLDRFAGFGPGWRSQPIRRYGRDRRRSRHGRVACPHSRQLRRYLGGQGARARFRDSGW